MATLGVLVGCTTPASDEADPTTAAATRADRAGYVQEYEPGSRVRVDDFEADLLGGGATDASDLEERVTVVNVWGSWCAPCRSEAPVLRAASQSYAPHGVAFLGLNVRDNDAAARAFEERFGIAYPSVVSADSPRVTLAFGGQLTASAVPTTLVVDKQRQVAARVTGEVSSATLRALIDTVLVEAADQ